MVVPMHKIQVTSVLSTLGLLALTGACGTHGGTGGKERDRYAVGNSRTISHRMSLIEGIGHLKMAAEKYAFTYDRGKFRHWTDADGDGCNTRREVLISESIKKPDVKKNCKLRGGTWYSYFDDVVLNDAKKVSIDHMVPLAEAWRSGAFMWNSRTRESFANDTGHGYTLVGVTRSSNEYKSDKDPSQWVPPNHLCRYLAEWTTVKLRWGLSADFKERKSLKWYSENCKDVVLQWDDANPRNVLRFNLRPY